VYTRGAEAGALVLGEEGPHNINGTISDPHHLEHTGTTV
jgi:hypothetical protein